VGFDRAIGRRANETTASARIEHPDIAWEKVIRGVYALCRMRPAVTESRVVDALFKHAFHVYTGNTREFARILGEIIVEVEPSTRARLVHDLLDWTNAYEDGLRNSTNTWNRRSSAAVCLGRIVARGLRLCRRGDDLALCHEERPRVASGPLSVYNRENFELAPVEAMACGTPVVCTDWGGFRDTIAHGQTGYRVATTLSRRGVSVDLQGAAEAVALLTRNRDLRREMGRAARPRCLSLFSQEVFRRRLDAIMLSLARDDGRPLMTGQALHLSDLSRLYRPYLPASGVRIGPGDLPPSLATEEAHALYLNLLKQYATSWCPLGPSSSIDEFALGLSSLAVGDKPA
jgi:hypothetical protein